MELDTVEKDGRLVINVDQNHTVANLIRKAVWENGGEAAYDTGHPLGGESNLVVEADNPEQVIEDAIETAKDWFDELEDQL
ncbi:MAG: DNA-directed RNA polymerase subunit L [Candidatus Nanohaloarchaea archaeon]|jgi:DNA-directed RNA polymerase subunit L